MTILLGVDIETTGLDPKVDEIIEIAFVLWEAEQNTMIAASSFLAKTYKTSVSDDIHNLTGLSQYFVNLYGGLDQEDIKRSFIETIGAGVDYIVAHNAEFEQSFLDPDKQYAWIDTKTDLPYPPFKGEGVLSSICMSHGIMNIRPHRALPDTLAMMQLLAQYNFDEVRTMAESPEYKLFLKFAYDSTNTRQGKAKKLGYHWNPDFKVWERKCKEMHLQLHTERATAEGFNSWEFYSKPVKPKSEVYEATAVQ